MNNHNNSMQIKRYTLSLLMALVMQDASCSAVNNLASGVKKALKISKGALQKVVPVAGSATKIVASGVKKALGKISQDVLQKVVPAVRTAAVAGTVALSDHLVNKIEGKKSEMNTQDHAQKGSENTKEDPKKEEQQDIREQFAEIIDNIQSKATKQALEIVSSIISKNAVKIAENAQKIAQNSQSLNGASANAHRVDSDDNQTPENSTQKSDG